MFLTSFADFPWLDWLPRWSSWRSWYPSCPRKIIPSTPLLAGMSRRPSTDEDLDIAWRGEEKKLSPCKCLTQKINKCLIEQIRPGVFFLRRLGVAQKHWNICLRDAKYSKAEDARAYLRLWHFQFCAKRKSGVKTVPKNNFSFRTIFSAAWRHNNVFFATPSLRRQKTTGRIRSRNIYFCVRCLHSDV